MPLFIDAKSPASSQRDTNIPTGSPQLDDFTGGIKAKTLFLFYGDEEPRTRRHKLRRVLKPHGPPPHRPRRRPPSLPGTRRSLNRYWGANRISGAHSTTTWEKRTL